MEIIVPAQLAGISHHELNQVSAKLSDKCETYNLLLNVWTCSVSNEEINFFMLVVLV